MGETLKFPQMYIQPLEESFNTAIMCHKRAKNWGLALWLISGAVAGGYAFLASKGMASNGDIASGPLMYAKSLLPIAGFILGCKVVRGEYAAMESLSVQRDSLVDYITHLGDNIPEMPRQEAFVSL